MKGRVGSKSYDTDKSELIETRDDGIQVYRKVTRPSEFYIYNPQGKVARDMFFDLPPEEAIKYVPENNESKVATNKSYKLQLTPYEHAKVKRISVALGMPMNRFVMMLVDEYEKRNS